MRAKPRKIKKILIANRGEIAVRIMRSCRDLGISTVAVYSEADRNALHVQMADEAYCIGPAPSVESYLVVEKIMGAVKKSGADAVHPGYGFLSEKAIFSKACRSAGIIFLGPSPEAIETMGDKIAARKAALAAKVPMVPGVTRVLKDVADAKKIADEMKYPVLLKASAGGGGKGMRIVESVREIESAFERAGSEAKKAFNDDCLYVEKFFPRARHIEIQVIGDLHGNALHFFERECSLQRRHQKVVEEAPSAFISEKTRELMTASALRLVKKTNYTGVGTVEFLVDEKQNFYFLEMNTRLQVEHPVTELITGQDMVSLQIEVGEGREITVKQSDLHINGSAIEVRIYAEDPENNFMPSPGIIQWMKLPEGPGIRHDCGMYPGVTIPIYYDPIIAKLVVWGKDRKQAIARMKRALSEYEIGGIRNNIPFLKTIIEHPDFEKNNVYTRYLDDHPELQRRKKKESPGAWIFGVAALNQIENQKGAGRGDSRLTSGGQARIAPTTQSTWRTMGLRDSLENRY